MGGTAKTYDPAEEEERVVDVEAEDIEIGTSDKTAGTDLRTQGKRSLLKPATSSETKSGAVV